MEMTTCSICGKIFGASSGSVCPACRKTLDVVYDKARAYLRDHPKESMNATELAKAIKEDGRLVEILMIEGRFDTGGGDEQADSEDEKKRKRLLEDLQKNLSTPQQRERGATTYASDRHGTGKER